MPGDLWSLLPMFPPREIGPKELMPIMCCEHAQWWTGDFESILPDETAASMEKKYSVTALAGMLLVLPTSQIQNHFLEEAIYN